MSSWAAPGNIVICWMNDSAHAVAIGVIGVKGRKRFILNIVNKHLDEQSQRLFASGTSMRR
jgi:hypothetical protein